ncbi:uncharacterized protein F5Z01DRAFT_280935 [Emericellopsis atlantica]|uniref:NmrA-like domain-containing protein n=1 Tax=Emericellopsis atlantica TaxID=2614577 RepID=A0A9P8CLW3_9HYPO|nr:uncharacterized protein F5Z01DRAFT_280935 [Emericellopsis atlantica]KAG9251445.1 hypothetical protein F5Z01DRAFT_280935 [Emericellopsis atlantica]
MMRVAVAGGGGLGYLLATGISQADNAYNVIVLSRTQRTEYVAHDIQVHPVNYYSHESLSYALRGVDLVISTISGPEQINLIMAAGEGEVRHFIPSEFEGPLAQRPTQDAMDRGSAQALAMLQHLHSKKRLDYTVFSCGVFMERFLPHGLATLNIGYGEGVAGAGSYLCDMTNMTAEYPVSTQRGRTVRLCLTSVHDLVCFVIAAMDLGPRTWPREFTMRGDRLSVQDVIMTCSSVRNAAFTYHPLEYSDLPLYQAHYAEEGDYERAGYYQRLLATAEARYDFSQASLNAIVSRSSSVSVYPATFAQWLASVW